MLFLDDFSGHWAEEAEEYAASLRVVIMKVPPGLTWLYRPADRVWIKPVKDKLRKRWVTSLKDQLTNHRTSSNERDFFQVAAAVTTRRDLVGVHRLERDI